MDLCFCHTLFTINTCDLCYVYILKQKLHEKNEENKFSQPETNLSQFNYH